jgi:hypothetical protein
LIPSYAAIAWLVALGVAVISRRFGLVAAEAMVVISLACGTAWLVSPLYDLSLQGIVSNDSLFFALLMYLLSLSLLAFRLPNDKLPRFQFQVRTLLSVTGLVAILLAMGPFGYVALAALSAGAVLLVTVQRLLRVAGEIL